jgi:MOSC domain-containing protein YiiM
MKVISVNVGLPREVIWKARKVKTGIFKDPIEGRVMVRRLNLDGDRQADLSVHGGPEKAVYGYSLSIMNTGDELPVMKLPWGIFGENLTTVGLNEEDVNIGDRFRVGASVLMVTQPRMPCYKLQVRFGRDDIVKRFLGSGRPGFYFSVLEEGEVSAGDEIELLSRDENNLTIADVTRLYVSEKDNLELLNRALRVEALPESWRGYFKHRIEKLAGR